MKPIKYKRPEAGLTREWLKEAAQYIFRNNEVMKNKNKQKKNKQ